MGGGAVVVLDVGGTATSVSLVVPDPGSAWGIRSAHSHRLEGLGGEVLAEALVGLLVRDFYGAGTRTADVGDRMALQRLDDAAREALLELGGEAGQRGRAQVNVPYLGVDGQMRPRHLDVGVGRTVLEAEVQELVRERAGDYRAQGVLAASAGGGGDLAGVLSSLVLRLLEDGATSPFEVEAFLVVGGGARSPIVQRAARDALEVLGGPLLAEEKLVLPEGELMEEAVVLGAAIAGGK